MNKIYIYTFELQKSHTTVTAARKSNFLIIYYNKEKENKDKLVRFFCLKMDNDFYF